MMSIRRRAYRYMGMTGLLAFILMSPALPGLGQEPPAGAAVAASAADETGNATDEAVIESASQPPVGEQSKGIDEIIDEAFAPTADRWEAFVLTSSPAMPFVLLLLVVGAGFFTIIFGFANRMFTIKYAQGPIVIGGSHFIGNSTPLS